jgi:hypothetical protein
MAYTNNNIHAPLSISENSACVAVQPHNPNAMATGSVARLFNTLSFHLLYM